VCLGPGRELGILPLGPDVPEAEASVVNERELKETNNVNKFFCDSF
jgi:hypothetical protein